MQPENGNEKPTGTGHSNAPGAASGLMLGRGVHLEGKLTFAGTVRVDAAKFVGSIIADVLVVGEGAKIDATITCGTSVVQGEVNGDIKAKSGVEIRAGARVRGDLETPSLVVEKGAFFQGATRMDPAVPVRAKSAA